MSEKFNPDQKVWHLGYNGPRQCILVTIIENKFNKEKDKAVILFHGSPEVVNEKDIFSSKRECYLFAAKVQQEKSAAHSRWAARYLEEAKKDD